MSFSQGWDAGFKSLLIYVGVVFFWLIFLEKHFADQGTSVLVMNLAGIALGLGFFLYRRRACKDERAGVEAEIVTLLAEER